MARGDDGWHCGQLTAAKVEGTERKIYLHKEPSLTNKEIAAAEAIQQNGKTAVEVRLTASGAKSLALLTETHQGKPLAIMLDGKVVLAPLVRDKITSGKTVISGDFTKEEAGKIARGIGGK